MFRSKEDLNNTPVRQIRSERIWTTEGRPEGVVRKEVHHQSLPRQRVPDVAYLDNCAVSVPDSTLSIPSVVDELQDHLFLQPGEQTMETEYKLIHHGNIQSYDSTLIDSSWHRNVDWLKWAGTPNKEDKAFVNLPRVLTFLYFFIRPIRLLIKHL